MIPAYHSDLLAPFVAAVDTALAVLDDATTVVALSGEAASYAEATTNFGSGAGKRMASIAVTAADFSASGAGINRIGQFLGKAGGTALVAGNPTVIAFLDGIRIIAQVAETGSGVISMTETVTFPACTVLGLTGPS